MDGVRERLAALIRAALDFHAAHQHELNTPDPDWSRRFQAAAKVLLEEVAKSRKALAAPVTDDILGLALDAAGFPRLKPPETTV